MENKTIFNVSRSTATGKAVNVGDFDTVEQAQAAMLNHYRETPKRGKFMYRICEEELEEIDGIVFRKICVVLSNNKQSYYKRFTADELKAWAD